jgi:hypothetical protein
MKGSVGAFLRRPVIVATLALSILMTTVSSAGATSVTTTTLTKAQSCGVVASPSVRIVSTGSICVISLHVGGNVRIKMRSGFRWGDPRSNSKAVKVTKITRGSMGVDGVTLHAVSVGHATIRTTGTVYCKPGVACPDLALLWSLRVIVTA